MSNQPQAVFIRRDSHAVRPVIYRLPLRGLWCDTWRCSDDEWARMLTEGKARPIGAWHKAWKASNEKTEATR
jgi:hypothetical protein